MPCSPYVNQHFGGKYHLHLQGRKSVEKETDALRMAKQYKLSVGYQLYRIERGRWRGGGCPVLISFPVTTVSPLNIEMCHFCGRTGPIAHLRNLKTLRVSAADPLRPYSRFSRPEPLLFLPSSSSFVLTRLSGPHSRYTTEKI
jgi:hypothetical protein